MENPAAFPLPFDCPADRVLRLIWGEWVTHILWVLGTYGPTRFGELRRLVEGISPKVLTDRLRQLEASGVVDRHYEPTVPPRVTYSLTPRGHELEQALRILHELGERWEQQGFKPGRKKARDLDA
jgi:DNA-binding HxlR family transcriptional regulator